MTRRERLERKVERRQEWADKARVRSDAAFDKAKAIADAIPFGQPILVGHHSEGRHRRDKDRIEGGFIKAAQEHNLAKHHESKADGLAAQLDSCIFSDDPDAVEALEAKASAIEAECERMVACNKAFRKLKGAPGWAMAAGMNAEDAAAAEAERERAMKIVPYQYKACAYPAYAISNRRANARRLRERIKDVQRRQGNTEAAKAAGGKIVKIHEGANWAVVVFAEKPDRAIIDALKAAGYRWGGGAWQGYADKLPECVK